MKFATGMLAQQSLGCSLVAAAPRPRPFLSSFPTTLFFLCTISGDTEKRLHRHLLLVMELDIYWITLLVLLPTVVLLTGRGIFIRAFSHVHTGWQRVRQWDAAADKLDSSRPTTIQATNVAKFTGEEDGSPPHPIPSKLEEATHFRTNFLSIYLLVMSSEWLSGPYLYPLLRNDKALPISIVVALYATAYTSAAISALGVGFLADRYGRRNACLAECIIHSLACLSVVLGSDSLPILFLGRVLAGVGLTLLWTVFESWMVTEWNARGLEGDGCEMSRMFGMMTTANCMTAIVGGVLGHCMVSFIGSKLWPFGAGIVSRCGLVNGLS